SPTCLLTGKRRGVVIGGADVAGLPARQGDSDGWRLAASPTAHLLTGPHALFMRFGAGKRCQKQRVSRTTFLHPHAVWRDM
ncbi:hypothetical protein ABG768_003340, partial [Culter alburnus]